MDVQRIKAPDGSEMVVLSAADYDALLLAATEDDRDRDAALEALATVKDDRTIPGPVMRAMVEGKHPVLAWLAYRNMSQADLARGTGLSQVWINRIINGGGYGSLKTHRLIAKALDIPLWALNDKRADA